jgi:phospholipid transport system substrate-binding protein
MFGFLRVTAQIRRPAAAAILAAMLLAVLIAGQARAQAVQDAGRFLADLTDRAVDELTEPGLSDDEQELRFRSLIGDGFDIPAIGRFVLGRYWRRASEEEQTAFLAAFEDMIVHRFLPLFAEYSGDKISIGVARPFKSNSNFISVSSKLLRDEGETVRIDWRVRRRDDGFRIVDIVAEGISIAVTLRSEYTSVLKQNGGDVGALARKLRAVIEAL